MHILPFTMPSKGYEPSQPEVNDEEGVLDIVHPAPCTLIEEAKVLADTLILRCALRPLSLQNDKIHVQLIMEGEVLENTPLYEDESVAYGYEWERKDSCWHGVALDYTGIGRGEKGGESFTFYGNSLPFGEIQIPHPLYTKPFNVELAHYQERLTTLLEGQVLRSPPGALDTQFLRGYGGYYKEGAHLEDIQQIYYHLTSKGRRTRVCLMTSTTLYDQRTPPPLGGEIVDYTVQFIPTLRKEEYLSLPGAIAAGYAQLSVSSELGIHTFSSYLCESVSGFPNLVNVCFQKNL